MTDFRAFEFTLHMKTKNGTNSTYSFSRSASEMSAAIKALRGTEFPQKRRVKPVGSWLLDYALVVFARDYRKRDYVLHHVHVKSNVGKDR